MVHDGLCGGGGGVWLLEAKKPRNGGLRVCGTWGIWGQRPRLVWGLRLWVEGVCASHALIRGEGGKAEQCPFSNNNISPMREQNVRKMWGTRGR